MRFGFRAVSATWLALSLASNSVAQVESEGTPASLAHSLPAGVSTVVLQTPDRAVFEAEAARLDRAFGGYRYGSPIATSVDSSVDGRWDSVLATGETVWRVRLTSPGARSLGVLFDRFDLPAGGAVYLYGDDGGEVLGAYTEQNKKPNGMLAVRPLAGDAVTVECVIPGGAGRVDLRIGEVIHDFRGILDPGHLSGGGGSNDAGCRIDINCSVGAPYQRIKRACVMAMANGVVCSASLVNNTAEDGTPYMLTAEHCPGYANGVLVFNYEREGCGAGASSMAQTVSGATLLASSPLLDPVLGGGGRCEALSHQRGDPRGVPTGLRWMGLVGRRTRWPERDDRARLRRATGKSRSTTTVQSSSRSGSFPSTIGRPSGPSARRWAATPVGRCSTKIYR